MMWRNMSMAEIKKMEAMVLEEHVKGKNQKDGDSGWGQKDVDGENEQDGDQLRKRGKEWCLDGLF